MQSYRARLRAEGGILLGDHVSCDGYAWGMDSSFWDSLHASAPSQRLITGFTNPQASYGAGYRLCPPFAERPVVRRFLHMAVRGTTPHALPALSPPARQPQVCNRFGVDHSVQKRPLVAYNIS
jgi:hypothetical protein